MNFVNLFKIFKWRYAKYLLALIVTVALFLIALMSCKTQQTVSESHETTHRQQRTINYDSSRYADLSTISDTRYAIVNETVWRPPDTLGRLFPLMTITSETTTQSNRKNNITSIRTDSLTMTDDYDYDCTATEQSIREPSQRLNASHIANRSTSIIVKVIVIAIITIAGVIAIKILRRFVFP